MAVTAGSGTQVTKSEAKQVSVQFSVQINVFAQGITTIENTRGQFLNSKMWSGPKKDDFDNKFCVFVNNMVTLNRESNVALEKYGEAMQTRYQIEGESFAKDTAQVSSVNATTQKSDSNVLTADFPSMESAIQAYRKVSSTYEKMIAGLQNVLRALRAAWISAAAQAFILKIEMLIKTVQAAKNMLDRAANALNERLTDARQAVENATKIVDQIADFGKLDFSGTF